VGADVGLLPDSDTLESAARKDEQEQKPARKWLFVPNGNQFSI
jgi:hypothetical protein